ncbi:MAG: acetyl-CoA carboxylase, biotin carboxyl carrier protein [Gammaproteobacteria bacterium]|nr:acetyl-CoA carboxylase, biotin carboxyl carrier protein [Gammaproteobacteria bacterium]|tara:strand:- start:21555 stop:22001 length:447 start_codon:yes stop_codon:yes gene_type:complete
MDLRKIKKLIEMLQESDLNEIEVKEGEESVRINRKKENIVQTSPSMLATNQLNKNDNLNETDNSVKSDNHESIVSPMVGTFYRKPAPDKEPFIEVGQIIKKGETVCIIEAMKMMNQVKSEFDGTVVSINIGDGEPVEFGQELISIEKS